MFQRILREKRRNGWKSRRKWEKSQRIKRREEQRLRKAREYAEPDGWSNVDGVKVGIHVLRNRFKGTVEYRFEFRRKDGLNKPLATDFGEVDLVALQKAVQKAIDIAASKSGNSKATRRLQNGRRETTPSKAASAPHVNQGNRK